MHRTITLLIVLIIISCSEENTIPDYLIGSFSDDYNIEYELSKAEFKQKPNIRYHILEWNIEEQFFIARNDTSNAYDGGLFSRIDWVILPNMKPYKWAFCLSAYNAPSIDSAKAVTIADRLQPKTGCNGYPFSRMKPTEK